MSAEQSLFVGKGYIETKNLEGENINIVFKRGRFLYLPQDKKERLRHKEQLKSKVPPSGTIESVFPVLQEAFQMFGEDQSDDGYWEGKIQEAPFTIENALGMLRSAGFSVADVAELVLNHEPRIRRAMSFSDLTVLEQSGFISSAVGGISKYYPGTKGSRNK